MSTETTVVETASAPAPVENAAPTTADEGKAPDTGTESTDTPASAAENPEKGEEKAKPSPGVQKRINELTRDKHQLREEKRQLEEELNRLRQQASPQEPKEPKLADFDNDADFVAAVHKYHQDKAAYDSSQGKQRETQEQEAQRKQEARFKTAQKFVNDLNKEKANYEGIDEVIADPTFALITKEMSPDLVTLIQESPKNVALFYHLGTHLEEAERIASLSPVQAARELALLESRLEIPKPKTVSNAPPPVKQVKGSSVTEKDIYDPKLPYSEYDALRKKQRAARKWR